MPSFLRHYSRLLISLLFLVPLIISRMIWHGNIHFGFLLWNLFLAWLPAVASHCIHYARKPILTWACAGFWLLFFPNTAYLLTDIVHLYVRPSASFWLDLAILFGAALHGVVLFICTLQQMESWYSKLLIPRYTHLLTMFILFIAGYGIYLGRIERWNSWDLLFDTRDLLYSIAYELRHPIRCLKVWVLSTLFTTPLGLAYLLLGRIGRKYDTL